MKAHQIPAVAAICMCGLALAAAPTRQTFTSRVEAVRLDVLVTVEGQPVKGLTAADFAIRDNGVPQRADFVSFEEIPLNVMLALDMSGSLTETALAHLQRAAHGLLDALIPGDRAGLITFNDAVARRSAPTAEIASIKTALDAIRAAGSTALVDAAYSAMTLAAAPDARGLVVVFSDGIDTTSWLAPDLVLATARRSEVVVYGVETGGAGDEFLRDLTDVTGGRLLEVESAERLGATFLQILEEFRHRYLVSFTPQGVSGPGWHRLDVRVSVPKARVRTRTGYVGG